MSRDEVLPGVEVSASTRSSQQLASSHFHRAKPVRPNPSTRTPPGLFTPETLEGLTMFDRGEDGEGSLGDVIDSVKSRITRVQDETCDFCGAEEGSMIKSREDGKVRCRDCFNDPDTYEDDG